jgi:glutamyl-tRNA synthetase
MTVRVRYAPSPTGEPHVGNIRTALFDWLLARHEGGAFVLRIEDTDRKRFVVAAVDAQVEALRWLGLDWDEGPDKGGPYGPYVQSERLHLYQAAARRLLDRGRAYECYCSEERLDQMRAEQMARKQPPRYDRRCRTEEGRERARREAPGATPVVRFLTPLEGETVVPDLLRGPVSFQNATLDDFVLLKSDGYPTYHLAEAVDDPAMKISHVIRGEEWLSSAPRHKLLFEALGEPLPVLIHTPVILGRDRAKLSKRHGARSVLEYRDAGYLAEAVFNFLGLLGWSLDDHTEIISREAFVEHFSLERLVKSPAVFDIDKLNWMNGVYMRELPLERLQRLITDWLERPHDQGGLSPAVQRPLDSAYTARILPLVRERVRLLAEARDMMEFFYLPDGVEPDEDLLLGKAFAADRPRAALVLSSALAEADRLEDWEASRLEAAFRSLAEALALKPGDLFMLLRVAVTGRTVAPPLFETMEIIGRERCLLRLRNAVHRLQ